MFQVCLNKKIGQSKKTIKIMILVCSPQSVILRL